MKVSSVAEMRNLDKVAILKYGIEEKLLMENAGLATCQLILREVGRTNKKFVVFCGVGNNGGDGCVIARKLHSMGGTVKVFILGDPAKYTGAAKMNLDIIQRLPLDTKSITRAAAAGKDLVHCDAVIDAIFGTGLAREVTGLYHDVIELINRSGRPVFSVDIPSGVNGDTGAVMGAAVRADHTVTYGLPKRGNLLYPGYGLCGRLYVSHISFPPEHYDQKEILVSINRPCPSPARKADGHKGDFGEALFIAGAAGYFGAPYFAALSFMKAGGGYSRLASPRSITPFIATKGSEIVFIPQNETPAGSIALSNESELVELSRRMDIVVMGPGVSLEDETRRLMKNLARRIERPLVLDGDGITALCDDIAILRRRKSPTVLTPHTGEMSRLTGLSVEEIEKDPIGILQRTAADLKAIIVLKGAHSLIGFPDGRVRINMSGNAGMATAGSGDVLTGTVAAQFGLGLTLEEAVSKGVYLHGLSGDLAALEIGEDGMTAQDILEYLPRALAVDRRGPSSVPGLMERYDIPVL